MVYLLGISAAVCPYLCLSPLLAAWVLHAKKNNPNNKVSG